MFTDKALAARYFSFLSSRSFGYETQKELRLDFQAFVFNYQHNY